MSAAELAQRADAAARDGKAAIAAATTLDELADAERRFLGKSSPLNDVREAIKTVDGPDRASVGKAVAAARSELEAASAARRAELETAASAVAATRDRLDLTLPPREYGADTCTL